MRVMDMIRARGPLTPVQKDVGIAGAVLLAVMVLISIMGLYIPTLMQQDDQRDLARIVQALQSVPDGADTTGAVRGVLRSNLLRNWSQVVAVRESGHTDLVLVNVPAWTCRFIVRHGFTPPGMRPDVWINGAQTSIPGKPRHMCVRPTGSSLTLAWRTP